MVTKDAYLIQLKKQKKPTAPVQQVFLFTSEFIQSDDSSILDSLLRL